MHGSKRLYRYRRLQLQTFEVWSRRLLSTWFIFAQQNIRGNNFKTLRIISGSKCVVSEREIIMPKSWEKRNMNGTRWSKTCKQLSFGATCLPSCQDGIENHDKVYCRAFPKLCAHRWWISFVLLLSPKQSRCFTNFHPQIIGGEIILIDSKICIYYWHVSIGVIP